MKINNLRIIFIAIMSLFLFACGSHPSNVGTDNNKDEGMSVGDVILQPQAAASGAYPKSKSSDVILGNPDYLAISYGAFRATERTEANVPSVAEIKEDMKILAAMGIKVLRTYNTQGFSDTANLLIAIEELMEADPNFEMYVMLGVWIDAKNSWTDQEVVHTEESENNALEMAAAVQMAQDYPKIIKVIAVGNEAMVHWAPYYVVPGIILKHVNALQALKATGKINKNIWITSSDNHASWTGAGDYASEDLDALIKAVDYISLHTYPFHDTHYNNAFWLVPANETGLTSFEKVDAAMLRARDYAISQTAAAQAKMLSLGINKPIHIGETGWSTETNVNYGDAGSKAADEYKQKKFNDLMREWSNSFGASLFFFEAFDEQWKGAGTRNPGDSEQHFGLINLDGEAKYLLWDQVDAGNFDGLTRAGLSITKSHEGIEATVLESVLAPDASPETGGPVAGNEFVVSNTGLSAVAWEDTAWIAEDAGIVTLITPPAAGQAKEWGWGAGLTLAGNAGNNLTGFEAGTLRFDIKGTTGSLINIGFQTGLYGNGARPQTNNAVIFGSGENVITSEWTTYSIAIADLVNDSPNFADVTALFYFSGTAEIDGGIIEVRNISYQK